MHAGLPRLEKCRLARLTSAPGRSRLGPAGELAWRCWIRAHRRKFFRMAPSNESRKRRVIHLRRKLRGMKAEAVERSRAAVADVLTHPIVESFAEPAPEPEPARAPCGAVHPGYCADCWALPLEPAPEPEPAPELAPLTLDAAARVAFEAAAAALQGHAVAVLVVVCTPDDAYRVAGNVATPRAIGLLFRAAAALDRGLG